MEADSPFWFDWRHHQSMNGIHQGLNGLIMGPYFSFQFDQLVSKLLMGCQIFSDPDKCSHHVNTHFNCFCGIENTGGHDGTVLSKGVGKRAAAAPARTWCRKMRFQVFELSSGQPESSLACCSSKASEMYLRKIRPRTTCLHSAASMFERSASAACHNSRSKPRLAPLLFCLVRSDSLLSAIFLKRVAAP